MEETRSPEKVARQHTRIRVVAMLVFGVVFVVLDFHDLGNRGSPILESSQSPSGTIGSPRPEIDSNRNRVGNTIDTQPSLDSSKQRELVTLLNSKVDSQRESRNRYGEAVEKEGSSPHVLWRGAPWKIGVGHWFKRCGMESEPITIEEVVHGRKCSANCNGHGVCNREVGECRCRSGYNGTDCSILDDHSCNREPWYPDKPSRWIVSICPGVCNNRTAKCMCGPNSNYPHRTIMEPCGMAVGPMGVTVNEETHLSLYSTSSTLPGWCNADPGKVSRREANLSTTCPCSIDGYGGPLCDEESRAYCPSGCNNHGHCYSGYCECHDGWYGIDCGIPSRATPPESPPPPWLRVETTPSMASPSSPEVKNPVRRVKRRRPLIYIYDLPGMYTYHHYEGRQLRHTCVPWMYSPKNHTLFNKGNLYGMEPVVLEALLASPHRTTNGEEADYFYVPVLTGCIHKNHNSRRPWFTSMFVTQAYEHIHYNYPYWNKSEGRDHIWMFPWDEGACSAPAAIWNSIMLSPWGNTMSKHNHSTTAYLLDGWDGIPKTVRGEHPCFDPAKDIVMPSWKPPNEEVIAERLWARPYEERNTLFYFSGQLGSAYPQGRKQDEYSMGIRQKVARLFGSSPDLSGKLGERSEPGVVVQASHSPSYARELSSSRFCGVFPGDGFSARMEDSILHGCIPVIIQDGIQLPYENFLNYESFAVRIAEDQIPNMITILKGIDEGRVRAMLLSIQSIWQRWSYHSVVRLEGERQRIWHGHDPPWAKGNEGLRDDDAIATLMEILYYKLHNDSWRKSARDSRGSATK